MCEGIYDEFGRDVVDTMRRELTAKNGRPPTYVELLAALYLKQGPRKMGKTVTVAAEVRR